MLAQVSLCLFTCLFTKILAHGDGFEIRATTSEVNIQLGRDLPLARRRDTEADYKLQKRVACGAGVGSCPAGQCCSGTGVCGTGIDFCDGPQCQIDFSGQACDAR